ncbi:mitochondrial 54S ribosomal protein bL32m [Mycosarcoma maydis]|uniref:Large ribosomal subunit protein bL32m n=1 Tax=Mycosarcoma maydis TaxID=5270 RepID=A0A0D1DTY2_MYCMD|nr:uncharacterized protein UMAG_10425 [Ustilago maydis 521]KIS67774.1 hypothetical protein UMAG_10425 [Ustilago maydis 521]|eukprot:XP_011390777.1 hypothetical protein UMAG_10425 [Ustilago maydis 521]
MWTAASRSAAAQLQLTITLGRSTVFRVQVPSLFSTPSSLCSTFHPLTPALSTSQSAVSSSTASPSTWASDVGTLLWDGILRAVPKKKVSHSRKSMRAANKGLKDRTDLVHCSSCGKPKLHHHICASCYFELNRARKVALKQQHGGAPTNGGAQQHP